MKRAFRGVGVALASIGGAAVMGSFVKSSIQTGMAVENLRVQMNALLGSVEEGGKAFEKMTEFAAGVPFSLDQIQAGSGSLAAAANNADELRELMQITGNIAAQFNIPFEMAAENVQRALSAGAASADLFQQKGVNAFMGFQAGVSYSSAETAKVLQQTFGTGGSSDGAMANFAKTSAGVASMFGDAMFKMQRAFAEGGLNEGFQKITKALTNLATALTPVMANLGVFANAVASVIAPAIDALANNLDILGYALAGIIGRFVMLKTVMLAAMAVGMAKSFAATAIAAHGATSALTLMQKGIVVTIAGVNGLKGALVILRGVLLTVLPIALFAGIAWVIVKFLELKKRAGSFAEAMKLLKEVFVSAFEVMRTQITGFFKNFKASVMDIQAAFITMLATISTRFGKFLKDLSISLEQVPGMRQIQSRLLDSYLDFNDAAYELRQTAAQLGSDAGILRDEAIYDNINAAERLKEAFKAIKDIMKDTEGEEAQEVALNKVKVALSDLGGDIEEKLTPKMQTLHDAAAAMGDGVTSLFRKMLDGTKVTMKDFGDMIKASVADMIAQIFRLAVINQMMNAIFGNVTGYTPLPTMNVFGKAGGGKMNGPTLVGERGPELYFPNTGRIANNQDTMNILGGGGGTVVHQTINVDAGVSQTVRAEMMSLLPRFKQDTMAAVVDAKRRGGSFGQAFG